MIVGGGFSAEAGHSPLPITPGRRRPTNDGGMTLQEIQVMLQAVSSFAIAGGLFFTGVQFLSYRKAAYVANFSRLVQLQMEQRKLRVDNPKLAYVHPHDVEGLAGDEDIQHYFMNLMQMSIFEIVWFSYKNGQLPEDYFQSWVKWMRIINSEESFRKAMKKESMKIFHADFLAYMQDLTRSTPDTPRA